MAQRNLIGTMVREGLISFVRIDYSVFKKTAKEKLRINIIKNDYKRAVKKLGHDPTKVFNPKGITL